MDDALHATEARLAPATSQSSVGIPQSIGSSRLFAETEDNAIEKMLAVVDDLQSAAISNVVRQMVRDGVDENAAVAGVTQFYLGRQRPDIEAALRTLVSR